jgi:hypothetical protein
MRWMIRLLPRFLRLRNAPLQSVDCFMFGDREEADELVVFNPSGVGARR